MTTFENYLDKTIDELQAGSGDLFSETVHDAHDHTGIPGVGGGGGGFPDLIMYPFSGTQASLPESTTLTIIWDPTLAGGLLTRSQGTAISFDIAHPTRININADGYYDLHLVVGVLAGTQTFTPTCSFGINGAQVLYYERNGTEVEATNANLETVETRAFKIPMSIGDYFEAYAGQAGNVLENNTFGIAQIQVTRAL